MEELHFIVIPHRGAYFCDSLLALPEAPGPREYGPRLQRKPSGQEHGAKWRNWACPGEVQEVLAWAKAVSVLRKPHTPAKTRLAVALRNCQATDTDVLLPSRRTPFNMIV